VELFVDARTGRFVGVLVVVVCVPVVYDIHNTRV